MSNGYDERDMHQNQRAEQLNAREKMQRGGITLQPWIVTLMLGFIVNLVGFAFTWGTVITRIDALDARIQRIERQLDSMEKFRSPVNYKSPTVGDFSLPMAKP